MTTPDPEGQAAPGKADLRSQRLAARRAVDPDAWLARDRERTARVLDLVPPTAVVATYLSMPPGSSRPEPGTLELARQLWERGQRVLAPRLSPTAEGPRHDPDWAWYEGPDQLVDGLWGIPEPDGPALGAAALGEADVVVCSAMAASPDGRRLGVGGGWFDRALAHARADALLVVLVGEEDVLDELPTEAHDRQVDVVVTERRTLRAG